MCVCVAEILKDIVSLSNLTGVSVALLPICLSNFRAIGNVKTRISRLRDFLRDFSRHLAVRRPSALLIEHLDYWTPASVKPPLSSITSLILHIDYALSLYNTLALDLQLCSLVRAGDLNNTLNWIEISKVYTDYRCSALWSSDAIRRLIAGSTLVEVDGTKPLPKPMLTTHQWGSLTLI